MEILRLSENKEIKELKNINDIQSLFIYDLINENQYYLKRNNFLILRL